MGSQCFHGNCVGGTAGAICVQERFLELGAENHGEETFPRASFGCEWEIRISTGNLWAAMGIHFFPRELFRNDGGIDFFFFRTGTGINPIYHDIPHGILANGFWNWERKPTGNRRFHGNRLDGNGKSGLFSMAMLGRQWEFNVSTGTVWAGPRERYLYRNGNKSHVPR